MHLLPFFLVERFAGFLAFLLFRVIRYRRDVALENLQHAFPEKTAAEREAIAYASYRHFALLILEFLKVTHWKREDVHRLKFHFDAQTLDIMENRAKEGGIVVSGHLGNWEMAIVKLASGYIREPIAVQKRQKNRLVDQKTIEMRERWGIKMIHSRGAIARLTTALKQKKVVALLADQDAGSRGCFVNFFGRPAATPVGPAVLHLRTGAPMYFLGCIRTGRQTFDCTLREIPYRGDRTVTDENITAVTAGFTRMLERYVRRYPEQYLWMHQRWKTRPVLDGGKTWPPGSMGLAPSRKPRT